jgi:hypothetical protein
MRFIIKLMQLKKIQSLNVKLVMTHVILFLSSLEVERVIVRLGLGLERGKNVKRCELYLAFDLESVEKCERWFFLLLG